LPGGNFILCTQVVTLSLLAPLKRSAFALRHRRPRPSTRSPLPPNVSFDSSFFSKASKPPYPSNRLSPLGSRSSSFSISPPWNVYMQSPSFIFDTSLKRGCDFLPTLLLATCEGFSSSPASLLFVADLLVTTSRFLIWSF